MALRVESDGTIKLVLKVQDDGSVVVKDFAEDAEKKLGDSSKKIADNTKKDLEKAGIDWDKYGKRVLVAVTAAVGAAAFFVKQTIDMADNMLALSERTGISVESLSAWQHVAEQSNTSLEAIIPGLRALATNMQSAADGTDEQEKAFERLKVEVKDGKGGLRDMDAVMLDLADRFSRMEDGATKTALAQQIFGRGGLALIPILNQGRDGIGRLTAEAKKLGIVFSTEAAKAADEFNDTLNVLKGTVRALAIDIVEKGAPAFTRIATATRQALEDSGPLMAFWVAFGGVVAEALGTVDKSLLTTAEQIRRTRAELAELEIKFKNFGDSPGPVRGLGTREAVQRDIDGKKAELKALESQLQTERKRAEEERKKQEAEAKKGRFKPPETTSEEEAKKEEELIKQRAQSREEIMAVTYQRWQDRMKAHLAVVADLRKNDFDNAVAMGDGMRELFEADQDRKAALAVEEADAFKARSAAVFQSLQTESAAIEQDFVQRSLALKAWIEDQDLTLQEMRNSGALSEDQFNQERIEANALYYDAMKRLDEQYSENKLSLKDEELQKLQRIADGVRKGELKSIQDLFGQAVPLMQSKSRTMFAIGKAAAIAEATISTYRHVASALEVKPYWLAIVLAATAFARGIANVQAIRNTQLGASVATPVFSASPSTGLPESPFASSQPAEQPDTRGVPAQHREVNLYVRGWLSEELVREELVPALNDAIGDGVIINVRQS